MTGTDWVLWGFNAAYTGQDGYPYPFPLEIGTVRQCNAARAQRGREGGWTMARYRAGAQPTGLRIQCTLYYPARSHLGEIDADIVRAAAGGGT